MQGKAGPSQGGGFSMSSIRKLHKGRGHEIMQTVVFQWRSQKAMNTVEIILRLDEVLISG